MEPKKVSASRITLSQLMQPEHANNLGNVHGGWIMKLVDEAGAPVANARVLAVWNSVVNFAAGEDLFRPILNVDRQAYLAVVKETLKFILLPAFTRKAPQA